MREKYEIPVFAVNWLNSARGKSDITQLLSKYNLSLVEVAGHWVAATNGHALHIWYQTEKEQIPDGYYTLEDNILTRYEGEKCLPYWQSSVPKSDETFRVKWGVVPNNPIVELPKFAKTEWGKNQERLQVLYCEIQQLSEIKRVVRAFPVHDEPRVKSDAYIAFNLKHLQDAFMYLDNCEVYVQANNMPWVAENSEGLGLYMPIFWWE